jgi:hypothetical protein
MRAADDIEGKVTVSRARPHTHTHTRTVAASCAELDTVIVMWS